MVVIAQLRSKSGSETEVENALRDMVKKVAEEKGTLVYTLHRSKEDPQTFLFYEKYVDEHALSVHSQTPYFKALFNTLGPLLEGAPSIDMYDEVVGI